MKIAVESNDGKTIKSPFDVIKGYLVFEVNEKTLMRAKYLKMNKPTSFSQIPYLSECKTIITRGMDREKRERFKEEGFDIFVTFNTSARDALDSFIKEKRINQPEFVQNIPAV